MDWMVYKSFLGRCPILSHPFRTIPCVQSSHRRKKWDTGTPCVSWLTVPFNRSFGDTELFADFTVGSREWSVRTSFFILLLSFSVISLKCADSIAWLSVMKCKKSSAFSTTHTIILFPPCSKFPYLTLSCLIYLRFSSFALLPMANTLSKNTGFGRFAASWMVRLVVLTENMPLRAGTFFAICYCSLSSTPMAAIGLNGCGLMPPSFSRISITTISC